MLYASKQHFAFHAHHPVLLTLTQRASEMETSCNPPPPPPHTHLKGSNPFHAFLSPISLCFLFRVHLEKLPPGDKGMPRTVTDNYSHFCTCVVFPRKVELMTLVSQEHVTACVCVCVCVYTHIHSNFFLLVSSFC
jgi:hypothetical protein